MNPTERYEGSGTDRALQAIWDWVRSGTNEGISFELSRLTNDLFTDSFLCGGDISIFTAGGRRGTIRSQLSTAHRLDSGGGAPTSFPLDLSIDLDRGKATLEWTFPGGSPDTATLSLDFVKLVERPEGKNYLFGADEVTDDAAYAVSLILL